MDRKKTNKGITANKGITVRKKALKFAMRALPEVANRISAEGEAHARTIGRRSIWLRCRPHWLGTEGQCDCRVLAYGQTWTEVLRRLRKNPDLR